MQDDLADLIARVEAGAAEQQRELLEKAARTIWGWAYTPKGVDPDFWVSRWNRFHRMLDARAFESAALMMVPEFLAWHISSACPRDACATIESGDDRVQDFKGRASTPALALTAAILRARRDA